MALVLKRLQSVVFHYIRGTNGTPEGAVLLPWLAPGELCGMAGVGRLKRQASSLTPTDVPRIVEELRNAPYEEKEKVVRLMDVMAAHDKSVNPGALVMAGAIAPLVDLVKSGNDGSQIYAASTLATIASTKQEYQDKIVGAGGIKPLCALLRMGSNKVRLPQHRLSHTHRPPFHSSYELRCHQRTWSTASAQ